jgi:hypothetical protein
LKNLKLQTHQHVCQSTSETATRKTRRFTVAQEGTSQAHNSSTSDSGDPRPPQFCDKPTRNKATKAVANLCARLTQEDSDLEETAADEYEETQSDTTLAMTTDVIMKKVANTTTGKLTKKSKAIAKQKVVEVGSDSDGKDSSDDSDSAEEPKGKYICIVD